MTTTPEQLAKWRGEFEATVLKASPTLARLTQNRNKDGRYEDPACQFEWVGYLRRCQETEQAIKDARKQALEDAIAICNAVLAPTKESNAEAPTAFRDAYITGVNRCINRLELLK